MHIMQFRSFPTIKGFPASRLRISHWIFKMKLFEEVRISTNRIPRMHLRHQVSPLLHPQCHGDDHDLDSSDVQTNVCQRSSLMVIESVNNNMFERFIHITSFSRLLWYICICPLETKYGRTSQLRPPMGPVEVQ